MTPADRRDADTEPSPALGIRAFAEKTLVAAEQCTKVAPAARPAAVGLLGCGVMAGLSAASFQALSSHSRPPRDGRSLEPSLLG